MKVRSPRSTWTFRDAGPQCPFFSRSPPEERLSTTGSFRATSRNRGPKTGERDCARTWLTSWPRADSGGGRTETRLGRSRGYLSQWLVRTPAAFEAVGVVQDRGVTEGSRVRPLPLCPPRGWWPHSSVQLCSLAIALCPATTGSGQMPEFFFSSWWSRSHLHHHTRQRAPFRRSAGHHVGQPFGVRAVEVHSDASAPRGVPSTSLPVGSDRLR